MSTRSGKEFANPTLSERELRHRRKAARIAAQTLLQLSPEPAESAEPAAKVVKRTKKIAKKALALVSQPVATVVIAATTSSSAAVTAAVTAAAAQSNPFLKKKKKKKKKKTHPTPQYFVHHYFHVRMRISSHVCCR